MCTFQTPNSLWIRLKGKTWHYNHYIHSKDLPTVSWLSSKIGVETPPFLEGKWTLCCRWVFPCASVSVVQRIWNSGIRSLFGQVSCVHIHICVHAYFTPHMMRKAMTFIIDVTFHLTSYLQIYICLYALHILTHTIFLSAFRMLKESGSDHAFSNVVPQKLQRHPPQAAPPPASTLHCASPPSVARHPCKSHSSTTVSAARVRKPSPFGVQDILCTPGCLHHVFWTRFTEKELEPGRIENQTNAKKKSEFIWIWKKRYLQVLAPLFRPQTFTFNKCLLCKDYHHSEI